MARFTRLSDQLNDYHVDFIADAGPERSAAIERAIESLRDSGLQSTALKTGARAPDTTLLNAIGKPVTLSSLWSRGPLVVLFYRGAWCPYCNLQLRAWQDLVPQAAALGASIVAISSQTPDDSLNTAEKHSLAFPVLSDSELALATSFGIVFNVSDEAAEMYSSVGDGIPKANKDGRWSLPLPATYVVGQDGVILFAHIEADYRQRAEPADVLSLIRDHQGVVGHG